MIIEMKVQFKAIFLFVVMLLLSGCYEDHEPNNIAYVCAIGIDETEDNDNCIFTIQFAKPAQISGDGGGSNGENIVENVCVEAPDLYAAISTVNHIVSKSMSMAHMKLMVFSDKIARGGITDIVGTMVKSREIRPHVYLAVAEKCSAYEYLSEIRPVVEINPAKYYQLIFENNDFNGIPKNPSQNFSFYEKLPERDIVMPVVGVAYKGDETEKTGEENKENNKKHNKAKINDDDYEFKIKNYMAGEAGVYEQNKAEAMGMAIFSGDELKGYMGSIESGIYNMLTGKSTKGYITVKTDKDDPLTLRAETKRIPKIHYNRKENRANIKIMLECDLVYIPEHCSEENIEGFEKKAEKAINDAALDFLYRTSRDYGCDIVGIGSMAKMSFLTNDDFEKYDWRSKYKTISFDVKTKLHIRRTGLTVKDKNI